MIWFARIIGGIVIGLLFGLVPFFLGRYLGRPRWGLIGLILSAIGGAISFGVLGFILALVFTIICFVSKSDLRTASDSHAGASSRMGGPVNRSVQNNPIPTVTCLSGPMNGQVFRIGANGITIGRESDCMIRFGSGSKGVSRHHCCLRWDGNVLVLVDLNSTYGTWLSNGTRLMPNNPQAVSDGTVFYLGSTKNTFQISM